MRTPAILLLKLAIVCLLCALGRESCICGENEKYDDELTGTWVMERVVYGAPGLSSEEARPLKDPITVTYSKGWYLWESRAKGKRYFKYRCDRSKSPHEFDAWRVETKRQQGRISAGSQTRGESTKYETATFGGVLLAPKAYFRRVSSPIPTQSVQRTLKC